VDLKRTAAAALLTFGVIVTAAACQGAADDVKPDAIPAGDLHASAIQTRFDETSGILRAGITNNGEIPISVTTATIVWAGFSWPTIEVDAAPVAPGLTAAFKIQPGVPHCSADVTSPTLTATVNGKPLHLPLTITDGGLLDRLRASACAERALAQTARMSMSITDRVVSARGGRYLAGSVVLTRLPGASTPITVVDVLGSVLFDVLPDRAGRLPATLASDASHLRVPIIVGPTRRCDPHARGQASQPFLFGIFTRTGNGHPHRTISVPSAAEQQRLLHLMDQTCGD